MPEKDKLDLSNKNNLDLIVDHRRLLVIIIVVLSVFFAFLVPRLQTDPTLRSGMDTTSDAYRTYQEFVNVFGDEEFILVAARNEMGVADPRMLEASERLTRELEQSEKIAEVISLSNMRVFQKKGELFGNYPVVRSSGNKPSLPDPSQFAAIKKALPLMDLLVSKDMKTLGILIRVHDQWKYDPAAVKALISEIRELFKKTMPPGTDVRLVGPALIRQAIVRYNLQTGVIFGILCMLIGTVVTVYVFKSATITAITNLILGICVLWVLGLMSLLGIPLNSTTALSFGFIPITTVEIVIHMVVRYHQFHALTNEKISAIKKSVRWLARPCMICSATTAVGFGTLMVSSIPMVRQLGFIMSVGIMISYCLAMALTPAFFSLTKSLDTAEQSGVLRDWMDSILLGLENAIFAHSRLFVTAGIVLTVLLFAGAPYIRSDTQILRMLTDTTPEVQDIAYVENNLSAVNSLELMLHGPDEAFKDPAVWKKVADMENRLAKIPEVVSIDSLLPLLEYLHHVTRDSSSGDEDLLSDPALIPQLLMVTSLSTEGERVAKRFVNADFDRLHLSIRIKNSPTVPIGQTIETIREVADSAMKGAAEVSVTGELTVIAKQTSELITDQIRSMFLAAIIITVLMMIQMNSFVLGLICLIPNIPPVAAVFGIMGWFGISLDSVTVFAATVAIGLAVDNTIHYVTQLRREIQMNPEQGTEKCVSAAYRLTAKQIASWSVVTLFGFLALSVSPFRPVVFFGILGCSSIVLGLYGDLIFVQSLILSSSFFRNTIRQLMDKQLQA
ncbi:MAG TPA: efflux RND transporter permease subunit [Desulfomonilaceae bacterium]|nr:efflux RND transporter permease subunit [Desulfomonilaceae bacterium]